MTMTATGDAFDGTTRRHGTTSGWRHHQERNERPCDACYQAKADYDRRRRSATPWQQRNRAHAKAQGRALRRLARLYPDQYAAMYAQEKARAFQEAGLSVEAR